MKIRYMYRKGVNESRQSRLFMETVANEYKQKPGSR